MVGGAGGGITWIAGEATDRGLGALKRLESRAPARGTRLFHLAQSQEVRCACFVRATTPFVASQPMLK
jgi:hypothetical protein